MTINAPIILAALRVSDQLLQEAIVAIKTLTLSNEDFKAMDRHLEKLGDTFDVLEQAVYNGLNPMCK